MKILVVVSEFPKITETFAIVNVLHYLSQGHDARVFHLKPFRHGEVVHSEAQPVVDRGFTYGWLSGPSIMALLSTLLKRPGRLFSVVARMIKAMRGDPKRLMEALAIIPKSLALGRYAKKEGVDHLHGEFASHPATAAWIASEVYDIPFSYSAHMYDIFVSQALLAEKSQDASFVRVISDFNRKFLSNVDGFDQSKLELVRCGVSAKRFPPRQDSARGPQTRLLYVGSLEYRKGVDVLLSALTLLKDRDDWHLTVLGGGPEAEKLHHLAETNLPGRVDFFGPAKMHEVKEAMFSADALVIASRTDQSGKSEGIPVVSMEALASRLPVIAPRLSGIPELIEDGQTGYLFTPEDATELAAKITHVIDHPEDAGRMAEHGRKRVFEEYNIDQNAEDLLQLMKASAS
ncbi:MAG: glycosyltransferase family 4 protein [Pseudomonadota bacterium]